MSAIVDCAAQQGVIVSTRTSLTIEKPFVPSEAHVCVIASQKDKAVAKMSRVKTQVYV